MPTLNIAGLNRLMEDSSKRDEQIQKESTRGSFRREQNIANQFANNLQRKSLMEDESEIDPYSSAPKKSKTELFKLSNSKYQTSLLESLVKNQHNKAFNESVLNYQSSVLLHLENINSKLEQMISAQAVKEAEERKQREYKREHSELAKNVATGNLEGIYDQILTTLKGNIFKGGNSELSMIMGFLPLLKGMFTKEGMKQTTQGLIPTLLGMANPKLGDAAKRFQEDPVSLIQDYIDQLAVSNNATLAKLFGQFASKGQIQMQENDKVDMKALAKFDNKVYMAITKIMPDQLIKQTDLLEAFVTGKQISPHAWDWENNKLAEVATLLERYNDERMTVRKGTDSAYENIMATITESLKNNDAILSKFDTFLQKDENGRYLTDSNQNYILNNDAALKDALAAILQSKSNGIAQLRGGNSNIAEFMASNKLDTKIVNGKIVKASPAEIASRRQMYSLLQTLLTQTEIHPEKLTELEKSIENIKSQVTASRGADLGAYTNSMVMGMYDQLTSGELSPEEFKTRIAITSRNFGGGSSGSGGTPSNTNMGANQTDNQPNPKLYKNSQGYLVPFSELSGYEQENYRRKELAGDLSYGEEAFQKSKMDFDNAGTTLTDTQTKVLELLNLGIIDHDTYSHLMTNSDDPEVKQQIDKYHKKLETAAKYFNKLDRAGLTVRRIRGNYNISEDALRRQGYVSTAADVYRFIGDDGKLNESAFRNQNKSLYNDKTMKMVNDINIDKLESEKGLVDATNPIDSAAELMSTLFGDPEISRAAGFVAGGMGGIGLSKILQMMGKKPGLVTKSLPVVMATLMTTNYAQRWANNIFGAEGQIKNAQGYSNRDIFMSKLMLKWLPMIGIGAKTTQITAKLMSSMGPLGLVFGVPISLASGLIVGTLGTKMLNSLRTKLFSEENQNNGSVWGMAGKMIMEKLPWLGKYLGFGSAGRKATMTRIYQQEKAKLKTEYNTTFNTLQALQKDPNADPKKIAEAQAKLKATEDAIKIYSDALKDLDGISKNDDNQDYELNRIETNVQNSLAKLAEKDSEAGESIRKSFDATKERIESENNFNAGAAADQKLDLKGTNAVRQAILNMENNPDLDDHTRELLNNAKAKIARGESISLEELFAQSHELSEIAKYNQEVRSKEYERQLKGREGDKSKLFGEQFRYSQFDELERLKNDTSLSEEERKRRMQAYYNELMDGKDELREEFESKLKAKENESIYLNRVINSLRTIYPDMPEPELIRLATRITHSNLGRDSLSDKFAKSGIRRKFATAKNIFGSMFNPDEVSSVSADDMTEDSQFRARMESYYKYMNSSSTEGSGSGVNLSSKVSQYFSQSALAGFKFKDNTPADRIGCALAAFNNMLQFIGFPMVDPNTLIMIAEGHRTQNGISSSVFPHLASPLGLKCRIYTVDDNQKFVASHLLQNAPNKMRGMIILLRDDKNENNHYITIKSIKRGLIEYLDPQDVGNTIKTGSLSSVLLRIKSFILFDKDNSTSTNLKESSISKNENNNIHRNTIKNQINNGMARLVNQAKVYGASMIPESVRNKISSLKDKMDDGSSSDTAELSVLEKINIGIQSVYEALVNPSIQPVSIYEDQTIPLQTTDSGKAESLIREMKGNGKESDENLQNVASTVRDQGVKKESEDSQKVQDAILQMAEDQKNAKEEIKEAKPVDEKWNTDNQPLGGVIGGIRNVLAMFGGVAGSLAGALATIAPAFLLWQNAKGTVGNLKDKFFNFFKSPKDAVYNEETGRLEEEGSYRDFSGMLRDTRNIKNGLFIATDLATNKMNQLVSKVGGSIAEKGTELMGKSGFLKTTAGKIINKFGLKAMGKSNFINKVVGGGARFINNGMDTIVNKTGNIVKAGFEKIGLPGEITGEMIEKFVTYLKDKSLTILDGVQKTVSKIPFLGKYADKFIAKAVSGVNKLCKWIVSTPAGKKLMAKLAKESGETAAKSVPFLNIAVLVASAISAVWNGWRHADQILGIPQDTVTIPLKMTAIAAKMIWDVLPNLLSVIMAYVIPGAGALTVDVCVAILQMFIGFPRFLSWFGFDEDWKNEKRNEFVKQKQAEKESQNLVNAVKKGDDAIQKDIQTDNNKNTAIPPLSPEAKSLEDKVNKSQLIKNDQENKNNLDDNKMNADPKIARAELHSNSIWSNIKNTLNNSTKRSLETATLYSNIGNQYNSLYKVKTEEERQKEYQALLNTPEMKAMKEQWEKSGSEWFHPLGDPNTRVTSAFGPRNVIGASKNHKGIDFSSKGRVGEKIYAAKSGKVITSSSNYGIIDIMHPDGTTTRYMHLSERYPKVGSEVSAGDVIGLSGGVGSNGRQNAYKPHLHFEIRDAAGNHLDPFLKMGLDPSVINVNPQGNNRENIAYLERHPFLLDKIKNEKAQLEKEKETKQTKKEETPTIKTKEAGDMPRNQELAQQAEQRNSLNTANKIAASNRDATLAVIKTLMEMQAQTVSVLNNINSTLVSIRAHLEENLNNDIVDMSAHLY